MHTALYLIGKVDRSHRDLGHHTVSSLANGSEVCPCWGRAGRLPVSTWDLREAGVEFAWVSANGLKWNSATESWNPRLSEHTALWDGRGYPVQPPMPVSLPFKGPQPLLAHLQGQGAPHSRHWKALTLWRSSSYWDGSSLPAAP